MTEVASVTTATGAAVWDRLWRHRPSDHKDDALIEREQCSPRWALIVSRLEATFGSLQGLRTIELGSGRGDLSALLARHGADVTLLDASTGALDQARCRFERLGLAARYMQADFLDPLDGGSARFDVSLSSGVIEHFRGDDRTRTVRAHLDALRPGGMAIISVPNARCLPYRLWKGYLEFRGWWPYGMEIPYTSPELRQRAYRAGFSRVEAHCLGFWQSVGDHWGRSLMGSGPDWVGKPSRLDSLMGMTLLTFAWRAEVAERPAES